MEVPTQTDPLGRKVESMTGYTGVLPTLSVTIYPLKFLRQNL